MHHSNAEWFWNRAAINHLALPAPCTLSMHGASAFSTSAVALADAGICSGMSNVNLNRESTRFVSNIPPHCKYSIPRPLIPSNWYAQYVHGVETYAKYHETPVLISNELNALIVNEYSPGNMCDEMIQFRQGQSTHYVNSADFVSYPEENELNQRTSKNSITTFKDDVSLAPPKKKWIRHYMMGEYKINLFFKINIDLTI